MGEWFWVSHFHSMSLCKTGLIISALSFSKDCYKVQMRKKQMKGDWTVEITLPFWVLFWWFPLWVFQTPANRQNPCFLRHLFFDISSSGKFCSVVYTHGFEAIYQNSSARNCIKMLAAGGWFSPNVLRVPMKEHREDWREGFFLFLPNHIYYDAI